MMLLSFPKSVLVTSLFISLVIPSFAAYTDPFSTPPTDSEFPVATLDEQMQDKAALLEIKSGFGNHPLFDAALWNDTIRSPLDNSILSYENSLPCGTSKWYLITCRNGHVTTILLESVTYSTVSEYMPSGDPSWAVGGDPGPLNGTIPWAAFLKLSYLLKISIQQSSVSGPLLTDSIDSLTKLHTINLNNNNLNGSIPEAITRLPLLDFDVNTNAVSGTLPANMQNLTLMTSFKAYQNGISGELPAEIGTLTNLTKFDVGQNLFSGSIPASFGNLKNLTVLTLQKCQLTGEIPSSFANLSAMVQMDLSQNKLEGLFPDVFGGLTNLTLLFLSSNRLYGPVPDTIWNSSKLTQLDISLNYLNGTLPSPPEGRNPSTFAYQSNCFNASSNASLLQDVRNSSECSLFYGEIYPGSVRSAGGGGGSSVPIAAIVVPCVAVLLIAAAVIVYMKRKKTDRLEHLFGKNFSQNIRAFSLAELKKATKNFNQILGKGGYGSVYKAVLKDASIVAVKRLDQVSKQGDVEFIREVELLSRLHHRHLVNLVGFCAEGGERMLVYEYMAMGSLYEHIHGPNAKEYPLSWDSRTKIAIHIALGLEYLHYGADPPLIHRDIKSANILLSDDGYSKVADFGLCKEAPLGADGSETLVPTATAVRGSFGYLDPEYVNTSVLSEKSDVYSYGVVLLELITGHKSIHQFQPLAYWAEDYLADREKTPLMVDPSLEGNFDVDELYALCDIARTCVQDQAILRPTIRDVAKALVENLGHALSSYGGSIRDTASLVSSNASETSSMLSSSYAGSQEPSEMSYQNYSETLHWTPQDSGRVSTTSSKASMTSVPGRLPVPVPKKPDDVAGSDNSV